MSILASFWTLEEDKLDQLLSDSKPYEKVVGKKPLLPFIKQKTEIAYPWFDVISNLGNEEKEFELPGMALSDFDLMLSETSKSIFEFALPQSETFYENCGSSCIIVDFENAQKVLDVLSLNMYSENDVIKFYDEDEKPIEWRFEPKDILIAGEHLKYWYGKITSQKLGILVIG